MKKLSLPKLRAELSVAPDTLDEAARTVEVIFYSGAPVLRSSLWDEPYELAFELSKDAVRLERFNAGASVLDNHADRGSVSQVVVGVVEKAWIASDGGHALIKIAEDRPDILARLKDGILRHFSMGVRIHQMRDVTEKGDAMKRLLAVDWEPEELSIVPVPADPGAQALAQAERFPCVLLTGASAPTERNPMLIKVRLLATGETVEIAEKDFDATLHSKDLNPTAPAPAPAPAPVDRLAAAKRFVDETVAADRAIAEEVERLARHFDMDEVWIRRHQSLGTPIESVRKLAAEERAKRAPYISGVTVGEERDSLAWRSDRMAEALAARATGQECPKEAKAYERFSFADAAVEYLNVSGRARGERLHPRHDAVRVFELALHSTSDFPLITANVLNKVVTNEYEAAPGTYTQLGQRRDFKDFRPHHHLRPGDFPTPKQVGPGGEYTYGTASENDETVAMLKYGVIMGLDLETLINDDVNAFGNMGRDAAIRAGDFENGTFFNLCILAAAGLGPNLSDSVAVYNAAHGNVGPAGGLDLTLLSALRALMRKQTSKDGIKLNVVPSILLCGPDQETKAEQLVSPDNRFTGGSSTVSSANP